MERRILALSRPHGVVARVRLIAAGVAPKLIDSRVEAGWLRPMYRGVYAVGPVQSDDAPYLAAVLACGDGAVLGLRGAAYLWRIVRHAPRGPVDVSFPALAALGIGVSGCTGSNRSCRTR